MSRWGESGGLGFGFADLGRVQKPVGWWGEVIKAVEENEGDWLSRGLVRVVGNGMSTLFWRKSGWGRLVLEIFFLDYFV